MNFLKVNKCLLFSKNDKKNLFKYKELLLNIFFKNVLQTFFKIL
jgi:hypothetical protein